MPVGVPDRKTSTASGTTTGIDASSSAAPHRDTNKESYYIDCGIRVASTIVEGIFLAVAGPVAVIVMCDHVISGEICVVGIVEMTA
jgi:hypothetical protein